MILLNPGPVNVSPHVRAALTGPDICHREPEYYDLQDAIRERLLQVFDVPAAEYTSIVLTGSGTAMVEAMVASSIPGGGRLLVVQNGVYGERIASMARAHHITCDLVETSWTERPAVDLVVSALAKTRYDALAVVHHETTTGLLNDTAAIAAACRETGTRVLVDAVSALGGEPFDFAGWRPDAVACTANKCVQGVPGLSFALIRREFVRAMMGYPERTVYLHLPRHHVEQERRSTPFTPAVQVGYALLAALDELRAETVARRVARYGRASAIVRQGLESLGFELLLPADRRSTTMTAVKLRPGMRYVELHDAIKRQGFVIYAGQGALSETLFRVATMGEVAEVDYRRFIRVVGESIARV